MKSGTGLPRASASSITGIGTVHLVGRLQLDGADDALALRNAQASAQLVQFKVGLGDADAPVAVVGDPVPGLFLQQRG